jgi:DNA-binding transcriptional MerR regulator
MMDMISHDQLEADTAMNAGSQSAPDSLAAKNTISPAEEYVRIEQVSARTGLTKRTLRYYEEIGLLAPPTRTEGGYRLYSEVDILHLQRIKRLKDLLGFSLAEIREIADAEEEREHVRAAWEHETDPHARLTWLQRSEDLTRRQLHLVEEKLTGLEEMRANLLKRLDKQEQRRREIKAQLGQE